MTYTVHDPRTIYDALLTRLASETGKNIGDTQAPTVVTLPYAVVYPLGDDPAERGVLGDPTQSTVVEFQVTSIGDTRDQAQWMANEVAVALSGWTPTVAGFSFGPISREDGADPVRRDDSVSPPLFYAADRYSMFVN